ncbi:acireductone dioxygenase (Ni2+-requiring) [Maudiozyma humilis]|uniref:Acireductone dioxygenase n=1 Tax=Maudiozyma humilis TaxID=51915 RepID=A0AAV5RYI5_MAUHU|nr:acireductone dioxygenase (Ni2+-requiring) [Kazachstania humilis]
MVSTYVHDNVDSVDSREPHNSGTPVSLERLAALGVLYRHLETEAEVQALARERHYKNQDIMDVQREMFHGDTALYESTLVKFYNEHLHDDEEIRYCLEGSGYFDIRDAHTGDWLRCQVHPGDLLIVPAGVYHRFAPTTDNRIKALRLFKDEPKWEAVNRGPEADASAVRAAYLKSIE